MSDKGPGLTDPVELRRRGQALLRPATRSLMELAASGDPHLAEPAVVALGKIGDPVAKQTLASLFDDDALSKEAVKALNLVEDPTVVDLLLDGSRNASPKIMAACAEAFKPWAKASPAVQKRLEELATHAFPQIRSAALRSLGAAPPERARPILLQALGDSDNEVVVVALQALGDAGLREEDLAPLESLFDRAQEAKVRATIADLLGRLPGKVALNAVKKALRDPNPRVRANAVEAVGRMDDLGDRRKIGLLKPMIQEGENNRVLANVAIAIGAGEPATSVQVLSKLLNSTEKWERASAVYAARFVKNDRVAGWLTVQLTTEPDPDVLRNVLGSLEHFEGDDVIQAFLRALDSPNPQVRGGAAKALGRTHDLAVETALVQKVEVETDQGVLCEVIRSLGKMRDSGRISLISRQLQHTDLRVQATAIEALSEIGSVEIVPYVEPFVNSTDNRVKANAAVALWNSGNLSVLHDLREMLASPSLKQRSSAVYAIGEVGESLRRLEAVDRYFLLASALEQEGGEELPAAPKHDEVSLQFLTRSLEAGKMQAPPAPGPKPAGEPDFPFEVLSEFFKALEAGDAKKAVADLERALSDHPADPHLIFLQGDLHRRKKELGKACEEFAKVSDVAPDFLNAQLYLANLYQESKEMPQSLQAYFKAIRAQLRVFEQYAEVGLELLEQKKVNEASLLLKDLVASVTLDSKAHLKAGLDFLKYKSYGRALTQLAWAYTTKPSSGDLKVGLAYALFKNKQYARSRALCADVLQKHAEEAGLVEKAKSLLGVMDKAGV